MQSFGNIYLLLFLVYLFSIINYDNSITDTLAVDKIIRKNVEFYVP